MRSSELPTPSRGEIWFTHLPTDPPGKGPRPVIVVSLDNRNRHPAADTVLVVPLTTSVHKDNPAGVILPAGETGLSADSMARGENISVCRKEELIAARQGLRRVSSSRICEIAERLREAMGC